MSESREHHCPRCGGYLPTVTVRVPVTFNKGQATLPGFCPVTTGELTLYEEREEVAECVRCTGAY